MTTFGYVRKNYPIDTVTQVESLSAFSYDELFIEKNELTTDKELQSLLNQAVKVDTVVVTSCLVFGKLIAELQQLFEELAQKQVRLISIDDKIDTSNQYEVHIIANLLNVTNKKIISERTKQRLGELKKSGKQLGRPAIDQETIQLIKVLRKNEDLSLRKIAEISGVSAASAFKYIDEGN